MKRAIRRFVGSLTGTRKYIFYIALFLICVVAICLGIYAQFFYKYADTDMLMLGNIGSEKTAEEIATLKANFDDLFTNTVKETGESEVLIDKIYQGKQIVYTDYSNVLKDENYYSVNVQVPLINIDNDRIKEINAEIKNEYYDKTRFIMRKREGNTIYNVSWLAFINGDILSVAIKASLKEEGTAEKVTIKTYNYDLQRNKDVSIMDLIESKNTTAAKVQSTIDSDIKTAYTNAKIIAAEYGTLYERDLNSDIYKVENSENYFLTADGNIYIVYAYGNKDYTNEMDIIIF